MQKLNIFLDMRDGQTITYCRALKSLAIPGITSTAASWLSLMYGRLREIFSTMVPNSRSGETDERGRYVIWIRIFSRKYGSYLGPISAWNRLSESTTILTPISYIPILEGVPEIWFS